MNEKEKEFYNKDNKVHHSSNEKREENNTSMAGDKPRDAHNIIILAKVEKALIP
jgi:hypothetical protein